jgi:4-hydroxy-4-methyl-2-oxoglutarate aldolase
MTALATASIATVSASGRRLLEIAPLDGSMALLGPAATCRCAPGDNLALHRLLAAAPAGCVLVCETGGEPERAYFGALMAREARSRGVAGLVLDGPVRDASALAVLGFPVFHRGLAPAPCAKAAAPSVGEPVELGGVSVSPGDIVVADRDAVLVVAREEWPAVEARARALEASEDELRAALARGERLGELLGLDLGAGA